MSTVCLAYGVGVESEISFSGYLPVADDGTSVGIRLAPGRQGVDASSLTELIGEVGLHGRIARCYSDGELSSFLPGQGWMIEIEGLLRFYWQGNEPSMGYEFFRGRDESRLIFWFLHIVLPFWLTLSRSAVFLHASAIVVGNTATLFMAPTGTGKSTLAKYMVNRGHQFLSDDKLALRYADGSYWASPAHGRLRDYRQHEDLGKMSVNLARQNYPVSTALVLNRFSGAKNLEPRLLTGSQAFGAFHRHILYLGALAPEELLLHSSQLAQTVICHELDIPDQLSALPSVHEAICRLERPA